ncbi:MAG TPA: alpha-amylase family protein [Propioniciclava tarda]|nr:alpha-amylase family protein [Propioniciclava tarda]HQA31812.1 alpha-amylase family protein [Propioniciclava tarda]HQD59981.1 alpha-amylase family protein [Propioniciclava tarda]
MSLLDHAIWWHVYPLGAFGAPGHRSPDEPIVARLDGLEAWLDYAVNLGCSGLLLGPIFDSVSHGYDTLDHYSIDPRLGDDAAFDRLIEACRARGMSVMLDGVFNHVADTHHLVAEGLTRGAWEGHGSLATLAHDDARVADLVTDIMLHWLRRGIAGWRLDVAYSVPGWFWSDVIGRVRQEFGDAVFLGEVIHGDYPAMVAESRFDSVTQYELWKAIWSSIQSVNFWELAHALERHQTFTASFVPNTFIGNHDVSRIASVLGDSGAALAAVLLFTLPGMPSIYYGDEQGFRGEKGEGWDADAPLRPALPATPQGLARVGWGMYRHYQELIGLRRRNAWLVRGAVEVLAKSNEAIVYAVRGDGHEALVSVELGAAYRASVHIDGAQAFAWQG